MACLRHTNGVVKGASGHVSVAEGRVKHGIESPLVVGGTMKGTTWREVSRTLSQGSGSAKLGRALPPGPPCSWAAGRNDLVPFPFVCHFQL